MALVTGPEAAINAIYQVLNIYLKTQLDALWTAAADSLPKPYDNSANPIQFRTFKYELEPYSPTVHIYGGRVQQPHSGAPIWGEYWHMVMVAFMITSDDAQTLDQQATRFGWGIVTTMEKHQQQLRDYISGCNGATVLTADMGEPTGELTQVGFVEFAVSIDESL